MAVYNTVKHSKSCSEKVFVVLALKTEESNGSDFLLVTAGNTVESKWPSIITEALRGIFVSFCPFTCHVKAWKTSIYEVVLSHI